MAMIPYFFYGNGGLWFILIVVALAGGLVSYRMKSKFKAFSQIPLSAGLTGKEVAEKMLRDNGIHDVKVISAEGFLTDHYNPVNKTVNLSPEVYTGSSVASTAVAAHECGHALQHAQSYGLLMLRSRMVPAVQFSSNIVTWILLAGILTLRIFPQLLMAGIILFGLTTLFSLITLPVEFDASARALSWMQRTRLTNLPELAEAKDALWWAAMTYVVAAISSLVTLVYYIMIFLGGRNRN